jgi:hypothetical protein
MNYGHYIHSCQFDSVNQMDYCCVKKKPGTVPVKQNVLMDALESIWPLGWGVRWRWSGVTEQGMGWSWL